MNRPQWNGRHQPLSESPTSAVSAEMLPSRHSPTTGDKTSWAGCCCSSNPSTMGGRCEAVYLLPTRLATVGLAVVQGGMLDCYLTHYNTVYWAAWIAGDVAVLLMMVAAFVISYRQMMLGAPALLHYCEGACGSGGGGVVGDGDESGEGVEVRSDDGGRWCVGRLAVVGPGPPPYEARLGMGKDYDDDDEDEDDEVMRSPGSMPLAYFSWLVYSAMLAIRVLIIYKNLAHQLTDDVFLGSNTLQMTVAMSSVVFLLLLLAHHDAPPSSTRRRHIDQLTYLVPFDLVDAADLLAVLSLPASRDALAGWVTWCVLGVACLNLVLPTLPLMALSRSKFGSRRLPECLQTLHRLMVLLAVNVPLLVTRLLVWHQAHLPVSSFLVKNVIVSFLVLYAFYERDHHRQLSQRLTS